MTAEYENLIALLKESESGQKAGKPYRRLIVKPKYSAEFQNNEKLKEVVDAYFSKCYLDEKGFLIIDANADAKEAKEGLESKLAQPLELELNINSKRKAIEVHLLKTIKQTNSDSAKKNKKTYHHLIELNDEEKNTYFISILKDHLVLEMYMDGHNIFVGSTPIDVLKKRCKLNAENNKIYEDMRKEQKDDELDTGFGEVFHP